MIDPPYGSLYGFPKPIPEEITDVKTWLVENGYPLRIIRMFPKGITYRIWYQ